MSRIEDALEKAAKMRDQQTVVEKLPEVEDRQKQEIVQTTRTVTPIDNPYLVAFRQPHSPAAEEYKKLKSSIIRMKKQDPNRNVILVTSAVGGEGKSLTATNLALSLSQDYDHTVLLIDADLRKPTIHTLLQVTPESGLSDCVVEERDIASSLMSVGNANLTFLSSGTRGEDPVELVSSQRMQKVILEIKYRYPDRFIIIDTPPVLLFAETKMMSSLADGIVFVIREGRAPRQHVQDALDALKGENILGIVYNGAEPNVLKGHSSYHSYYRDYSKL